ncbi:MAG TPA: response regulator [Spongiibacteraceae bacterium]|nr:response regulator [Spongiibacteraceae bacterium]
MAASPAILIVEDEPKLASLLADYLSQSGYTPHCIADGNGVLEAFVRLQPAAVLLDLMLPGKDGITLCREIRAFSNTPILMITARVEEIDRLLGLELGADDYICKPFSPREVISRVKAVLRRSNPVATAATLSGLVLDENRLEVRLDNKIAVLTAVEFQLLKRLASEPGRIFPREQLMEHMYNDHRVVSDRTIDSHIKKLRKKLAEIWSEHEFVHSVYGVGYRFELN